MQQQTLGFQDLLAHVREEFLEQSQSSILDLLTDLEEWGKDGNEVTIVVLEALCELAPLSIENFQYHEYWSPQNGNCLTSENCKTKSVLQKKTNFFPSNTKLFSLQFLRRRP